MPFGRRFRQRALVPIFAILAGLGAAFGQAPVTATITSTLNDQKETAVTVYNQDLALVRDVRRPELPTGSLDLRFMDIAAKVNPAKA